MKKYDKHVFPELYHEIATEYIEYKQSLGFKYGPVEQRKVGKMLDFIYRYSVSGDKLRLTEDVVKAYALKKESESVRYCHSRQSHIRQFALFLNIRGIEAYVYPKELIKTDQFIPHIFTSDEIVAILREADRMQPNKNKFVNTPLIYPAVIRVLYGCGLRVGEALSLSVGDVDLGNGIILVRQGKNNTSRLVPISESLRKYLFEYDLKVDRTGNEFFFPALRGEQYSPLTIRNQFYRFEEQAGIKKLSNGRYPRVHVLRHTFSVHALEQMIKAGQDPYCCLPILSTYLGHKGLESTEKYLRLVEQYFTGFLCRSADDATQIFSEVSCDVR